MTAGTMIQMILRGYADPRTTLREVLSTAQPLPVIVLCVLLAYFITQIALGLMGALPPLGERSFLGTHILGILTHGAQILILGTVIYWGARAAGGAATRLQTMQTVAWHDLVTSLLTPFVIGPVMQVQSAAAAAEAGETIAISPGAIALMLIASGVWFWLLAVYVSAVNGFRSAGSVLAVLIGVPIGAAIMLLILGVRPG